MKTLKFKLNYALDDRQLDFIKASVSDNFGLHEILIEDNWLVCEFHKNTNTEAAHNLLQKLVFISRGISNKKQLFKQKGLSTFFSDPLVELKDRLDVIPLGEGLFLFQGEFLSVFRACEKHIRDIALYEYDAIDQENPAVWPIDLFSKVNYLHEFPQQALLVAGVNRTHEAFSKVSDRHPPTKEFSEVNLTDDFSPATIGLQPAVCDTCYYALKGRDDVQNTVYTTSNKVFRNETSDTASLDRLKAFTVRDIMFVGDKNFVLHTRQKLIDRLTRFLSDLGLECKIEVADDPFFSGSVEKKFFQHQFELKYELLANIPFLEKWIAVGSVNLHLDTFSKAFKYTNGIEQQYSGCIGIGFERLLLALYSQFGTEVKAWPEQTRRALGLNFEG